VHGLQGHPQKTWSCKRVEPEPTRPPSALDVPRSSTPTSNRSSPPEPSRKNFLRIFSFQRRSPNMRSVDIGLGQDGDISGTDFVYWPRDLLPTDCPKARIMTWGYDTVVTKGIADPTNKSNIFAHARDLLFALGRERPQDRPLVFVAHSLGGIVVKEVKLFYSNKNPSCFKALELSRFLKGRLLTSSRCSAGPKIPM
jgi:protein SERAC1